MDTIKQEYDILIKKYKLPKFSLLDEEFEIRALEENRSGRPVKAIIRVIAGKLRNFLESLDPVINPNPNSTYSMIISNGLDPNMKEDIFIFYKKLASLFQECILYELEDDDKSAEFIKRFWKDWPSLKEKQKKFLKALIKVWDEKKEKKSAKSGYLG